MVAIRSPFCGYNSAQRVELKSEGLSCYVNKNSIRRFIKCLYANGAHFSDITVANVSPSLTRKMAAAKASWCRNYVSVALCIHVSAE